MDSEEQPIEHSVVADGTTSSVPRDKWRCVSMHDPAGRRGVWFAVHNNVLTVRGGREGDDAWAEIPRSSLPKEEFDELVSALEYGAWQQEDYGPDSQVVPFSTKRR